MVIVQCSNMPCSYSLQTSNFITLTGGYGECLYMPCSYSLQTSNSITLTGGICLYMPCSYSLQTSNSITLTGGIWGMFIHAMFIFFTDE